MPGCRNRGNSPDSSLRRNASQELAASAGSPVPHSIEVGCEEQVLGRCHAHVSGSDCSTDGWIEACPEHELQSIQAPLFSGSSMPKRVISKLLPPSRAEQLLPVGVSPWVMLFRGGEDGRLLLNAAGICCLIQA